LRTFLFEDDGEFRRAFASRRAHRPAADDKGSPAALLKTPAGFGGKFRRLWLPHLLFWPAALAALFVMAVVIKNGLRSERPRTAHSAPFSKDATASEMEPVDFYPMSEPSLTTVQSEQEIAAPLSEGNYIFGSIYISGFPDLTALTSTGANESSSFIVAGNSSGFGGGSVVASRSAGGDVPAAGPSDEPSHDGSVTTTSRIPDTGSTWTLLVLGLALIGGFKAFTTADQRATRSAGSAGRLLWRPAPDNRRTGVA
jgi:hypothetical protein